jgi:hypothetical protein
MGKLESQSNSNLECSVSCHSSGRKKASFRNLEVEAVMNFSKLNPPEKPSVEVAKATIEFLITNVGEPLRELFGLVANGHRKYPK